MAFGPLTPFFLFTQRAAAAFLAMAFRLAAVKLTHYRGRRVRDAFGHAGHGWDVP